MLYQLNAKEWRTLRRLHFLGGAATWPEIRPMLRRHIEEHILTALTGLGLIISDGEMWRITDRGRICQELGELDVPIEEVRIITRLRRANKEKSAVK